MDEKLIASKTQVFAIVRVDDFQSESIDTFNRVSVVKVMRDKAFADRECERLQNLVDARGTEARYMVYATRWVEPSDEGDA